MYIQQITHSHLYVILYFLETRLLKIFAKYDLLNIKYYDFSYKHTQLRNNLKPYQTLYSNYWFIKTTASSQKKVYN